MWSLANSSNSNVQNTTASSDQQISSENSNNAEAAAGGSSDSVTALTSMMNLHGLGGGGTPTEMAVETKNHQHNSASSSPITNSPTTAASSKRSRRDLPPLFWYMEIGDWEKAVERIQRHPREVKTWATLRTKSAVMAPTSSDFGTGTNSSGISSSGGGGGCSPMTSTTKRLALHHACFKLRGAGAAPPGSGGSAGTVHEDPYVEVCRFILLILRLYPQAAQKRESRHGCLPLHLAAFASCAPRSSNIGTNEEEQKIRTLLLNKNKKPSQLSARSSSDNTTETNMSAVHAEETYTGVMNDKRTRRQHPHNSDHFNVSVSMRSTDRAAPFSAKREEMLVQVINALLDAYPKAARVDSEGGRLPLHTACAGRATPRVISTLITTYPAAARQRNKDGFLPLHLAAHWGVSHIDVAVQLLKVYPDATVGRNRWERTPLEEALCMAGENGRPHQAALVRALRKHPSWWTRPNVDLVMGITSSSRRSSSRQQPPAAAATAAVDVDESLIGSNDGSTMEENMKLHQLRQQQKEEQQQQEDAGVDYKDDEAAHYNVPYLGEEVEYSPSPPRTPPGLMKRLSPRGLLGKSKPRGDSVVPDPLGVGVSLAHLIEKHQWNSVLARIQQDPREAEQDLQVMTRGGFMASTGMSPLHYACERKPPVEVVRRLVRAFPTAVLTRAMPGGCLPLHIGCTWGASHDVVRALLAADVGSVRIKDELGNIALHSACFSGAESLVVEALLEADSGKTVLARNHQGSRPIDICKRLRHDNRKIVMDILTNKKDELMRIHNRSRSSGMLSEIAREAEDLNQRHGAPQQTSSFGFRSGDDLQEQQHAVGVEVTYDDEQANGQNQLNWI